MRLRKEVKREDIIRVPLGADRFVYVKTLRLTSLVHRTGSVGVISNYDFLQPGEWFGLFWYNKFSWTTDCVNVAQTVYRPEEEPAFYSDMGTVLPEGNRYRYRKGNEDQMISTEETKGLPLVNSLGGMAEVRGYLESLIPQMNWVQGTPSPIQPQDAPAESAVDEVDFEINELPEESVADLAEVLPEAFDEAEVDYECIGYSSGGGNVAVRGPTAQARRALSVIRAQLRIHVPEQLLEHVEIERLGPGENQVKVYGISGPAREPQ